MNGIRLKRAERIVRDREALKPVCTPETRQKILTRLAEIAEERGGPEGFRAWLENEYEARPRPYAPGVDPARMRDKLTEMVACWYLSGEEREAAEAAYFAKWRDDETPPHPAWRR